MEAEAADDPGRTMFRRPASGPALPSCRPGRGSASLRSLAAAVGLLMATGLAPSPAEGALPIPTNRIRTDNWWSFRPVVAPPLPEGPERHPVDRFLGAEQRRLGIRPAPPATKAVLLRRVTLDLTGIPPTPEEQAAFEADTAEGAYERLVDRLLADEQHAVRYARHWLDVLRYADVDERMTAAPGIHLWRDWVVQALHDDLPYDQFVQVQLTGRRSSERSQISATGHRFRPEPRPGDEFALGFLARGTGEDPQDLAISAVDTVSSAFLGMTVSCAKCHDHMFDPVSQREYYAMKALFDPLVLRKVTLAPAADLLAAGRIQAEIRRRKAPAEQELEAFLKPFRDRLYEDRLRMLPADVQAVVRKPERERSVAEQKVADDYFPILRIDGDKVSEVMTPEERRRQDELRRKVEKAAEGVPAAPALPVFHTVEVDRVREREKSFVLTSGDPARPQRSKEVQPGWPFGTGEPDLRDGRIEAFTDWLTAPGNPLFARVAVNRLWQWHFGEGLHRNVGDFGGAGGLPTQPALLDWLASEFVRSGFRMKALHRLIVTSEAYRRASHDDATDAVNRRVDPENMALGRFPLRRLEAEPIWDALHAAAGNLDTKVGGPSFEPPNTPKAEPVRRGAFMVRGYSPSRDVTPAFLQAFDVDDGRVPCPMRTRTVTAPQALFLMNSAVVERAARGMGERLSKAFPGEPARAVDDAFRRVLGRPPTDRERTEALELVGNDPAQFPRLAWLLFNLDEFLYVP